MRFIFSNPQSTGFTTLGCEGNDENDPCAPILPVTFLRKRPAPELPLDARRAGGALFVAKESVEEPLSRVDRLCNGSLSRVQPA